MQNGSQDVTRLCGSLGKISWHLPPIRTTNSQYFEFPETLKLLSPKEVEILEKLYGVFIVASVRGS